MRRRIAFISAGIIACTGLAAGPAAAANTVPDAKRVHFTSVANSGNNIVSPAAKSGVIHAGDCDFKQGIDNVHYSHTSVNLAVQSHGAWYKEGGTCPKTAKVTAYIQAHAEFDDHPVWVTVEEDVRDERSGGGGGKHAVAHVDCDGTKKVSYRSYVDVDLDGVPDPKNHTYSPTVTIGCYPKK